MVKKVFYILFLFLFPLTFLYPQWQWQNPLPQGNSLYSIQYVNDELIWASGTTGTLLKSTDGGESWEFIMLQERMYVRDIFFINEETGWICGRSENSGPSHILSTTNGGSSWETQLTQLNGGSFKSIVFANENYGWSAGFFTNILHTTNGGQNWFVQADAPTDILSIFLLDSLHLWAATSSSSPTLKTSDGGINWVPDSTVMWAKDVHFLDTLMGWAAGWSSISKTTNGGLNWKEQYYLLQEEWVDIFMLDENYGWVVSISGLILATTNGGEDWIEQNNPAILGLSSIAFKDSLNGITVGDFASLLKTSNGGTSWENKTQSFTEEWLFGLHFINENIGWVSGENGTILKTTNSGEYWVIQNSGVTKRLREIYFRNELMGWSLGNEGTIINTTNGGGNWNINNSPTLLPLYDINFDNYPFGWIVGGDVLSPGQLFKTTNGGSTWNTETSITLPPADNYELQFTSNDIGWIMVGNSTIGGLQRLYRTSDGGDNWDILLSNNSDTTFRVMYFINDSTGWISTYQKIFHTTDGGIGWERFEVPSILRSIYFSDSLKGWGGAISGEIYITIDGGISWEAQHSPMDNPINKLFFYGDNYGWAVGFQGNIIHTSNGGVSFVYSMETNIYPDEFILYQNYPNPFNPLTKIRFEIPTSSVITLKIYDVLGRELKTLVNGYKNAGSYEVEFNGSQLASGIYFYKLTSSQFTLVKKLILLK
jgi:photosystem II stability/assembly factor-like uncharacterized protein